MELKLSVAVATTKLAAAFARAREAMQSSPAIKAQMAVAIKEMFDSIDPGVIVPPAYAQGILRRAIEPSEPWEENKADYACLPETGTTLAESLRSVASMAHAEDIALHSEGDIKDGQGVVFRAIVWWFQPVREWAATWMMPLPVVRACAILWLRGRTGKSTREPLRFKGWKGSR